MIVAENLVTKLVDTIVDHLDIPKSYYEKAAERHRSLGKWLCRTESKVAAFKPNVSSQGSFRYGTVIRPVHANAKYDLDNVTTLEMAKIAMTQKQLKELYGAEIKEYAEANCIFFPVEETNRCWRLNYSDEVPFHLDTLPCIGEEQDVIRAIIAHGVPPQLATLAVAITDKRHPNYEQITRALLSSNPRGFAAWFEDRTRPWALPRLRQLVERRLYKSVEDVPAYEWNTPLQRSIQFLKRHRDVMFRNNSGAGPISMIITNLAAHAYAGESDLYLALTNIVEGMPKYVNRVRPRVPNPADPAEDYADKWTQNPTLENNFWAWHTQVKVDIAKLPGFLAGDRLFSDIRSIFQVDLTQDELRLFESSQTRRAPVVVRAAPVLSIPAALKPWGEDV
jgi:hypothetical protein